MSWLIYATIVAVSDVIYHMGYKAASTRFSGLLYILILNISICFFCLIGLAVQKGRGEPIIANWSQIHIPLLLGSVVCLMEFATYMTYSRGAPFSLVNPFMSSTIAVVTLAVGYVVFKEKLEPLQYLGLALCLAGIVLLTARSNH